MIIQRSNVLTDYTPAQLGEINRIRRINALRPLNIEQSTPATFRRLLSGMPVKACVHAADGPTNLLDRPRIANQALQALSNDLRPPYGRNLDAHMTDTGCFAPVRVFRRGISLTAEISALPNIDQLNAIARMFDTTSREHFFALIVDRAQIFSHETSLFALARLIEQSVSD